MMEQQLKIGALFAGYGGLDQAVSEVTGAELAWVCEWDDAPSKILAHHYPDVPNFRDVSKVDWEAVPPVDILTGGFPCQDVSLAGARKGLKDGTRSGLWSEFAKAIEVLKPRLVVIENVRGLLSASAGGDVEPCAWCLGDDAGESHLRALGAVLGDLADLGFDARWQGVRAADAGAPHNRFRVFIVAYPSNSHGVR
jgi:DNA (cytosine-5)-methyltransferase 1